MLDSSYAPAAPRDFDAAAVFLDLTGEDPYPGGTPELLSDWIASEDVRATVYTDTGAGYSYDADFDAEVLGSPTMVVIIDDDAADPLTGTFRVDLKTKGRGGADYHAETWGEATVTREAVRVAGKLCTAIIAEVA